MSPDGSDVYARSTPQFGIEYERAVLSWFDALPPHLRGEGSPGA
ncbi:MAG: hypothetical protein ACJ77A_06605 [Actinomycetota bacterium]